MKQGRLLRWGPFTIVAILSAVVAADRSHASGLATFVGELFLLLPVGAMIAVGGTRTRAGAAGLALFATTLMVALDLMPQASAGAAGPTAQLAVEADQALISGGPENRWLEPGAIGRTLAQFPQGLFFRGERDSTPSLDSPLLRSSLSLLKLSYLLVPFGLIGWALGVEGWVRRRVVFLRPTDERLARLVIDIGIAAFVIWFTIVTASRAIVSVVLEGNQAWTVCVPFALVLLAGVPGWLQERSDRSAAPPP